MSSSFTLAPGRLEAAGRSRGGQHAAQSRPPTPQRQSVLPGSPPDLQLSGVTLVRRVTQRSVPCKLQTYDFSRSKSTHGDAGTTEGMTEHITPLMTAREIRQMDDTDVI